MIGYQNQFVFDLVLNDGTKPTMGAGDILSFQTSEQTGNDLPHFSCSFRCIEPNLTAKLQDGLPILVSFGLSDSKYETFTGYPLQVSSETDGRGTYVYTVSGTAGAGPSYYAATKTGTSRPQKSEDIAKRVASRYFNSSTNLVSNSQQPWIQPSISDKQFLDHLVERASVPGSWVASAIALKGNKYRLEDMIKRVSGDYDWRFTLNPGGDPRDVFYYSHTVTNRGGLTNAISGYGRQFNSFDTLSGEYKSGEVRQGAAFGPAVKGFTDLFSRLGAIRTRTPNMHPSYHEAMLENKVNSAAYSAYQIHAKLRLMWRPFQPLDTVLFLEGSRNAEDGIQTRWSDTTDSGLFIIDSIQNQLVDRELQTDVFMTRSLPGM